MRIILLATFMIFTLGARTAPAYEDDVHYGLTKWLALKAGFAPTEAQKIAHGDKYVDGGALDAVRLTLFSACLGKEEAGSDAVLLHHFPSGATVPSPPVARKVTANSDPARIMSDRVINNPLKDYSDRTLRDFGIGLHALQDSYSHEGVPDVPKFWLFNCASQYAWGHPAASGGWNRHDPDLTYLQINQAKAVAMASTTYDQLCRYREIVQSAKCAAQWKDVQVPVERFVQASNKREKWAWFGADEKLRGEFKCEFLEGINLPDGGNWCESVQYSYSDSPSSLPFDNSVVDPVAMKHEKSPKAIIEATLNTWFVKRDVVALTRFFVEQSGFKIANGLAAYSDDKVAVASTAVFSLWLNKDHGSVHKSLSLNGDELMNQGFIQAAIPPGISREFWLAKGTRLVKYKSLSEALYEVGPSKELFDFRFVQCKEGRGECALAAARLKNAPYETLLLEYRKGKDQWLLVKVWSLVDH